MRPRLGRLSSALAVVSLAGVAGLVSMVGADPFDDACTAPANPVTPATPTTSINLAPGQTLVITGNFQGGIDGLPAGAQICVSSTGTFAPPYMNNAQGAVFNRGTITFPGLAVGSGFRVENTGTTTFTSSFNTNGQATVTNSTGTMTFNQSLSLNNSSSLVNNGTLALSDLTTSAGTSFQNTGTVTITGNFLPDGNVQNAGRVTIGGGFNTNSAATVRNDCSIVVQGGFTTNAQLTNAGTIVIGAAAQFVNQGTLVIDASGAITGGDFTNNRDVSGSGRFFFTGNTLNQGPFTGADAQHPINFFDSTPSSGAIFDTNNNTAVNVIRQSFTPPEASTISPGCASAVADVVTTKTGPATAIAGSTITYTIHVLNHGPLAANAVVITDALPPGVSVTSAGGGVVGPAAVTWTVATLDAGATQSFSLSVLVDPSTSGSLTNVVSSTAATADADPTNNDGTSPGARVVTTVAAPIPPNLPPTTIDEFRSTAVGQRVIGFLHAIDPDAGQTLTWESLVTLPGNGVATLDATGHYTYQPAAGFTGIDFFVAQVCDNGQPIACATARVTIEVRPLPEPDSATTTPSAAVVIAVTANDHGPATPPTITTPPANGTAVVNADLTVTYTPQPGFRGVDTFVYQICAPSAPTVCDGTTVTVTVEDPPNKPPVVGDVSVVTIAGAPVTFDVPTSDPDTGQTVSLAPTPAAGPANGTVVIAPGGIVTYTPNAGFAGIDTFVVTGCDDHPSPLCSTGTITVTVTPEAVDDVARTTSNTAVTVAVKTNDRGSTSAPTIVVPSPNLGTVVVNADESLTYTPAPGFTGRDTVVYEVCSINAATVCDTATLIVFVNPPPNLPPEVNDETATIRANTSLSIALVAIDPDGDAVSFTTTPVSGPTNGTVTLDASGAFTYAPNPEFTGLDTVVVEACDASPACGQGVVSITVVPIARDDTASTPAGTPLLVDVRPNDSGDNTPPVILVGPRTGAAQVLANGSILFTPAPDQVGIETLLYQVCSPTLATACDTALLTIFIPPLAVADFAVTSADQPVVIDAGANDAGAANLILVIGQPPLGTVGNLGRGVFNYTPPPGFTGIDTFVYSRCDRASRLCTNATVTIVVEPNVLDDVATTFEATPVGIAVLDNDIGRFEAPSITDTPSHGTATVQGNSVIYTPIPGFVGDDVFTYASCAPVRRVSCGTAQVLVTVLPIPNQPPVLTPLQLSTQQGITVTGTVAASDPDGQTVTFVTTALSSPANGTVTIGAGGTITYQPFAAFVGVDSFTVQACDPVGACSSAVVTVTVTATPPPTTPPPTGEVKPPSPPATLPRTGSDNGAQVEWAAIASLLGLAAIAIARRPRTRPRPR